MKRLVILLILIGALVGFISGLAEYGFDVIGVTVRVVMCVIGVLIPVNIFVWIILLPTLESISKELVKGDE